MRDSTRERVAAGLHTVGLLRGAVRLRRRYLAWRAPAAPPGTADGLPLPPARLRVMVDGRSGDPDRFVAVGAESARLIREALAGVGVELERLGRILDFGCGCGRVARHWASLEGPEIHACDHNPELARWCQRNLPFLKVSSNSLTPPTEYEDEAFDLVYALSVFTHLSEPLQRAWMAELRRILRPRGVLVFTTLGDRFKDRLSAKDRSRYEAGGVVVLRPELAGDNSCTALHPRDYVTRDLLADFSTLSFIRPSGNRIFHDAYVARRP